MNAVHREIAFEDAIERSLLASGWQQGQRDSYHRALGLDTAELFAFIGATQAREWDRLLESYGPDDPDAVQRRFAAHVAKEIDARGALDVLRHGVKDRGMTIRLAYFRPAHTIAADALVQYAQNRLTVTRQLHYSEKTPDRSLDLALFVNGIPVATAELKNPLTRQTVGDAKRQYCVDRDPKELLFARRALVHFAVDPDLVFVTTRLAGAKTRFLPFNIGSEGPGVSGGAGKSTRPARRLPDLLPVGADLAARYLAGHPAPLPACSDPKVAGSRTTRSSCRSSPMTLCSRPSSPNWPAAAPTR